MSRIAKLLLAAGIAGIALIVLATISYQNRQKEALRVTLAMGDVVEGHAIGGKLHAEHAQLLCLDPLDLTRTIGLDDSRREEVLTALFAQSRCTYSDIKSGFDMDAEGRQIYATPHGTIALWPEPEH